LSSASACGGWFRSWRSRAGALKRDTYALYLAARDRRTPWYARVLAALILAYALSPIDLIPDFVPILGYLDDLVLIPMGLALLVRLVPDQVLVDARARASQALATDRPRNYLATAIIVLIWLTLIVLGVFYLWWLAMGWSHS
jgi:uncharacterized membrane protein YkvA (DUF1232 family)